MVERFIAFAAGSGRLNLAAWAAAIAAGLTLASPVAAQGKVTPLFAEDTPLDVTLSGPIRELVKAAERSTDPYPATMVANGETLPIQLAARGNSRRQRHVCTFPPLQVSFDQKPGDASLFDKQGRIKLVAHCRPAENYEKFVLREYAAYRLYNVLTPESLKVRLARTSYVDDGKEIANRWSFFIEDIDDAARRLGGKEIEVELVPNSALDGDDAARYALFQYMIGNLDWDMARGPDGNDCCHNSKLVGANAEARRTLTPVPYDFDFSGLVDAPYAIPPEIIPVKSVRTRHYRGLCRHNEAALRVASDFLAARPLLEAEIQAIGPMAQKDRDETIKYLAGFFKDIASADDVQKNLLRNCR